MESDNGVLVENERRVGEEGAVTDTKEDEHHVDSGNKVLNMNGSSEIVVNAEEDLNSSKPVVKSSVADSDGKFSKPSKDPNDGSLKSGKVIKNQPNSKGLAAFASTAKRSLTQSLSFPSKGPRANAHNKSIDEHLVKADPKTFRANGSKSEAKLSNGSIESSSHSNPANRRVSMGLNTKENGVVASSRRSTIATMPNIQKSQSGKYGPSNGRVKCHPSEGPLSVHQHPKPIKTASAIKEDDDGHSTTSSNATPSERRRSSGSGFSFRLEERAEKRKEFFSKLEEKIQAREEEKNKLQQKSKENHEAEIKQLRKSLTFKATPIPSFYKEPPPKVELKKIPTTRAISPKLGRHKSPAAAKNTSSEGTRSCISSHLNQEQIKSPKSIQGKSDKDCAPSKKATRKSILKIQCQEPTIIKREEKPGEFEENKKFVNEDELEDKMTIEDKSELKAAQDNVLNGSSNQPNQLPEITVGG